MKIHNFEQNSQEWCSARLGVITASNFAKGITPKKLQLSSQSEELALSLAGEIITGVSAEEFQGNYHTDRGQELEPDAVELYEMTTGHTTTKVGFVTNDEGTIGASPDRLVGEDGGLEIKCPSMKQHLRYLFGLDDLTQEHRPQVQGNILVCQRKWWNVMSYHPELPPVIKDVNPDAEYLGALEPALNEVAQKVQDYVTKIRGMM